MVRRNSELNQLPDETIRILQVSDTHLYADRDKTLAGVNTLQSMQQTLLRAVEDASPKPDLIIATGDLVHDASSTGYHRLAHSLLELEIPSYWLPGNHDNAKLMAKCMTANGISDSKILDTGHWRILLLDSTVAGHEGGHLSTAELAWLEQHIQSCDKNLLLCLHHQPIPVGSLWIDSMAVDNGQELCALVKNYPQIKGVIWGHVHQAFEYFQDGVHWLSAPSTCIQFTPGSDEFSLDPTPPGCRLLALTPNGNIKSRIVRLDEMPGETRLDLAGY